MIDQQQHAPVVQAAAPGVISDPPIRQIIAKVATSFGLTPADLIGQTHRANVVRARHAAIHAVRTAKPHLSLGQIGRAFDRHHTTILHALRKMESEGVPQPPTVLTGAPSRNGAEA
ncbi:helix-turn-helix domain-containing protein [Methylorubrum zatmanii]